MELTICTIADVKELQQISRETFYDTFVGTTPEADMAHFLDEAYAEEKLLQQLTNPNSTFYFLRDDKQGFGNVLMNAAFKEAKRLQKKEVWLGVWEHNTNALAFYRKKGFKKFSEHVFVIGKDTQIDWLMKFELLHNN